MLSCTQAVAGPFKSFRLAAHIGVAHNQVTILWLVMEAECDARIAAIPSVQLGLCL